jgi:hypothetical protein
MNRAATAMFRLLAVLSAVCVGAAAAGDFALDWFSVDGGGEMLCTGGSFELYGTIGQPDAGVMTGGDVELICGFWPGVEEPFCFGDLDGDGTVALADLTQLLAHYGMMSGACYEDGDLDGDGAVGLADLQALLAVYGTTCP